MWVEADPRLDFNVQNSLRSSRHETLLGNIPDIPILVQHSDADENVPVIHSRRLCQLISQMRVADDVRYVELEGKPHWFPGALTTLPLMLFYEEVLAQPSMPELPLQFTLTVSNPADFGLRGGLKIDLLKSPDQLGKVVVAREPTSHKWVLTTSNLRQFHFDAGIYVQHLPSTLEIDGQKFEGLSEAGLLSHAFVTEADRLWRVSLWIISLEETDKRR